MKYTIEDYINELIKFNQIRKIKNIEVIKSKKVQLLTYNSKKVEKDTMFVCKGVTFKPFYLFEAIKSGAFIYVSENEYTDLIPGIIVKDIQKSLSILSNMYFNYPQDKLNVIGLTGTKGKSTTSYYVKSIIDSYRYFRGEKKTAILSSIDTYDAG